MLTLQLHYCYCRCAVRTAVVEWVKIDGKHASSKIAGAAAVRRADG